MTRDNPIMMGEVFESRMDSICCVYLIWCFKSQKGYVGSAVNWGRRMRRHRSALRGGYHDNKHLQSSFNCYGESQFGIYMLESCNRDDVIKREQYWINEYEAFVNTKGYNSCPAAGTRLGSKFTEEQRNRVRDAVNEAFRRNPDAWKRGGDKRRGRKLSPEHVAKVVAKCSKPYSFISPDGIEHSGVNYAEFCRKFGLNKAHIHAVIHGRCKSCKGWTLNHNPKT